MPKRGGRSGDFGSPTPGSSGDRVNNVLFLAMRFSIWTFYPYASVVDLYENVLCIDFIALMHCP